MLIGFFSVLLLAGVGLLCYPTFSDWWNRMHQSRAVAGYVEAVDNLSAEQKADMLAKAHQYNTDLLSVPDRWHLSDDQLDYYNETLDVTGTGIMGYVSVPSIDVRLPIYHGTDETVLQIALGHLTGSSLPVGGDTTHAVVSGHTGLPSARLLTGLDRVEVGDQFYVTVLDDEYWYEVDQINVVLPNEMDDLAIADGEDYVTLVTCTPYGVNSHRLLVRGHRIEAPATGDNTKYDDPNLMMAITVAAIALLFLLLVLLAVWLARRSAKRRRGELKPRSRHAHGGQ
nr:class C sortase [Bifidobacterium choloepi]